MIKLNAIGCAIQPSAIKMDPVSDLKEYTN